MDAVGFGDLGSRGVGHNDRVQSRICWYHKGDVGDGVVHRKGHREWEESVSAISEVGVEGGCILVQFEVDRIDRVVGG